MSMSFYDGGSEDPLPPDLTGFEFGDHLVKLDKARAGLLVARVKVADLVTLDSFQELGEAERGYQVAMESAAEVNAYSAMNLNDMVDFYTQHRDLRHSDLVQLLIYRPYNPFRRHRHDTGVVEFRLRDIAFSSTLHLKERFKDVHSTDYRWLSRDINDLHRLSALPVVKQKLSEDMASESQVFWSSLASRRGYVALKKAGFELPEVY